MRGSALAAADADAGADAGAGAAVAVGPAAVLAVARAAVVVVVAQNQESLHGSRVRRRRELSTVGLECWRLFGLRDSSLPNGLTRGLALLVRQVLRPLGMFEFSEPGPVPGPNWQQDVAAQSFLGLDPAVGVDVAV